MGDPYKKPLCLGFDIGSFEKQEKLLWKENSLENLYSCPILEFFIWDAFTDEVRRVLDIDFV